MVFYFTCSDPEYVVYMGKDKHENEDLIKFSWPEDIWFHVNDHSSAHVYLRLKSNQTMDDIPKKVLEEMCQLTKANSIEGCKLNNVRIIYTPASNLLKRGDMDVGQVGFHDDRKKKYTTVEKRNKEMLKRLNKTKVERHPNLRKEKEERDRQKRKEEQAEQKRKKEEEKRKAKQAQEEERIKHYSDFMDSNVMQSNRCAEDEDDDDDDFM
eukprot:gb/GECH01014238.1/.p1 GENE.gb/GECH01014238.1/~~gb/GECH01014238.1/.p1  ORF type:complete len:210 (+),score=72.01 gb/GECH01014238.1/:1-630(+)